MRISILCVVSSLALLLMLVALRAAQSGLASSKPSAEMPGEIPVFDINAMDKSADPCRTFINTHVELG